MCGCWRCGVGVWVGGCLFKSNKVERLKYLRIKKKKILNPIFPNDDNDDERQNEKK